MACFFDADGTQKFETKGEEDIYHEKRREEIICKIFPGEIPLCRGLSAHHPGPLRSAGLASLHQVAAGQPGAACGELSPVTCLFFINFPLFRSLHSTEW